MKELCNRNSNHELMRILSMFFIVLGHVLLFTGLLDVKNPNARMFYYLLEFILIIHVNSYVLVSGYYQSNSTFKQKKIWKIVNASWFYRAVIMIVFLLLNIIEIDKVQFLKDLLPVTLDNYWFIKVYLILYCLSPFLNKFINSISKKFYQKFLIVGFLIFCIVPTITGGEFFFNNGYSLYNFIYLYFVGAYLRIYPLEKSYMFKIFSKKLYRVIMICIFTGCVFLNNIIFYFGEYITGINSLFDLISSYINNFSLAYSNPIVIIQSIAYFCIFTSLDVKSKFINKCSDLMLGVYFIHENNYMRKIIYKWPSIVNINIESIKFIPYVILAAIIIFVSCMIIEKLRLLLFKLIYNFKISKKIRDKYYEWINQLKINSSV